MAFKGISISNYIRKHLKNNPKENEANLRNRLNKAIVDFEKGVKCDCGNDIWVIGSASIGNKCFTCVTGESEPNDDYEISSVLHNKQNRRSSRSIANSKSFQMNGFFDDNGNEVNMDIIPKPSLCISCINNENPKEEIFCNMTRHDQKDEQEFKCFAYKKLGE